MALRYIEHSFITERIIKIPGQAKTHHFFNYPIEAIEEALVNAVYHRSYEYDIREPIVVRINRQTITIVSHPGPDPSISSDDIKKGRLIPRRYRNRRIGELLKELEFTEGRGTGVPKMRCALANNGSPEATFFKDDCRLTFSTELKIHPEFLKDHGPIKVHDKVHDHLPKISEIQFKILDLLLKQPANLTIILAELGYSGRARNVREALNYLLEQNLIAYTIPDKPRSKKQQYKITDQGKRHLI